MAECKLKMVSYHVMKKAFLICALTLAITVTYLCYPVFLRSAFHLSGVVHISPELASRASRPNTVLFIIAKSMADIPVAVKRIVNPVFPLDFHINSEDLLLHDTWRGQLRLETQLNDHGQVGNMRPGDMTGILGNPVYLRKNGIHITIDKINGLSPLHHASAFKRHRRGDRLFAYPGR